MSDATLFLSFPHVFILTENGQVQEGFLCFVDVSFDRTADTLYEFVVRVAQNYSFECKIVSQIYDGEFVMSEYWRTTIKN
jgi:hypothetical protein